MKRNKILSIVVSIALLFSVLASTVSIAFASDYSNEYDPHAWDDAEHHYVSYMALGDSFTRGMGCSDVWKEETDIEYNTGDNQTRCITGAYPYIVAKELGCKCDSKNNFLEDRDSTYWPMTHYAANLSGFMDLIGIDDGYYDSTFYHAEWSLVYNRYKKFLEYFGTPLSSKYDADEAWGETGSTYDIRSLIEGMDVISIELGQGDIFNSPLFTALHEYDADDFDLSKLSASDIAGIVKKTIELMHERYEYYLKAFPLLLDYLTKANPDADILVLSITNPVFGVNISDDILVPIGNVFSIISASLNANLQKFAKDYGCIYVDISNVDTMTNDYDWSVTEEYFGEGNYELGIHP